MSNKIFNQKILTENAVREVNLEKHNLQERRKKLEKWIEIYKIYGLTQKEIDFIEKNI